MRTLKVKPDDKFIIEIAEELKNEDPFGGPPLYRVKGFPTLVFTKEDLKTLESYNSLKAQKPNCKNDTLYFINEKTRMCNSMKKCSDCPLVIFDCFDITCITEEAIDMVQDWSNEHPLAKTEKDILNQKIVELKDFCSEMKLDRRDGKIILEINVENTNDQ